MLWKTNYISLHPILPPIYFILSLDLVPSLNSLLLITPSSNLPSLQIVFILKLLGKMGISLLTLGKLDIQYQTVRPMKS